MTMGGAGCTAQGYIALRAACKIMNEVKLIAILEMTVDRKSRIEATSVGLAHTRLNNTIV